MSTIVRFFVNDQFTEASADDRDMSLLDFLHERLDLTGTKFCCGIGVCRACTVATRNYPRAPLEKTLSCSTPVSAVEGLHVYTVEGLAKNGELTALQRAFLDNFAFQCGYCTPGFLMAATAMMDHLKREAVHPDDVDEMIQTWVGGNLCRCTGYVRYTEAIRSVALTHIRRRSR